MMKLVAVQDAVGMALCHDMTEIVPGVKKGPAFRKGHIVGLKDIETLLRIGKEHLYIWEINEDTLHENDGALRLAKSVAGPGTALAEAREGKVEVFADRDGLLKVNKAALNRVNGINEVAVATLHTNQLVRKGQTLAGCKVIPLVIDAARISHAERVASAAAPLVSVLPLRSLRIGIVTTGSEVFHGRIQDAFGPVLRRKVESLGSTVLRQIIVDDKASAIADAVKSLIAEGAEMVLTTGGMAVDPDDVTPAGIREAGGRVVSYGAPVFPGSLFMLARIGEVWVLGLPGCVMFNKTTVFDLVIPRLLAGESIAKSDLADLGHGGLCAGCDPCVFPLCPFGKGS